MGVNVLGGIYDEIFHELRQYVTSRRRVEIQSTSEISPYFTMTKCNKLFLTRSTERLPSLPSSFFNHFNDGSYDYVIQKAVTKTLCMLSV